MFKFLVVVIVVVIDLMRHRASAWQICWFSIDYDNDNDNDNDNDPCSALDDDNHISSVCREASLEARAHHAGCRR